MRAAWSQEAGGRVHQRALALLADAALLTVSAPRQGRVPQGKVGVRWANGETVSENWGWVLTQTQKNNATI